MCFETDENFLQKEKKNSRLSSSLHVPDSSQFPQRNGLETTKIISRGVYDIYTKTRERERESECFSPRMRIGIYGTIKKKQRTAEDEEVPFRNRAEPTDSSREIT